MSAISPSRLVRVFISSTFRDFIEERDELVKKVFPELRRRCKERFVEVLEVDLRWGITEEQSKSGETLRICLEEIDRCRPSAPVFFVGLLGERYGWIPPEDYFKPDVLEDPNLGWVREHINGKSVTELEILHGVLRNEVMRDKAFFYFRYDGYQERNWKAIARHHDGMVPAIQKQDFTNAKSPTSQSDAQRQADLKRRVRSASFKWEPKDYETPREMAALVLEDLWAAIDAIFPARSVPEALERESLEHRVFMESRTRAYVKRAGLFESLDAFAYAPPPEGEAGEPDGDVEAAGRDGAGSSKLLPSVRVVLGESGSGKSALLAAWIARQKDAVVFFHFTGATASSVSGSSVLRRLLETLRKRGVVPLTESVPQTDERMVIILPQWLERLSERGGGILLFDAVNQLASARDRELWWWPERWPENIRVVFSTLPGDSLREMERRGWTVPELLVRIPLLQRGEKRSIMNLYLSLFSRALDLRLQDRLLAAPQAANPLFLRTVLDELRLRSRHEDLEENLDAMLKCHDPAALFVHVLKNLEQDFTPPEHPGLIHRALGLMGAALRGLSESEILQLLSSSNAPASVPLPRHYWAPLYLALEESLVSREGQLSFFHDYLRQAVWREYLDEDHELETAHGRLAETVTRWNDQAAFGFSLRAYGFEYGVRHLLACKRAGDAVDLILDEKYREAAASALHQWQPVLHDVARVRRELAMQPSCDLAQAAELAVLSLSAEAQLGACLRRRLDQCAANGDWEEVLALSSAEKDETVRLLVACRALTRRSDSGSDKASAQLRAELTAVVERWAESTGKSEWGELVGRLCAETESENF